MKKEKSKIRGLYDVINDVNKVFKENNNSIPVSEVEKVSMLFSEANEITLKNKHDGNIAGFFILIFFIFTIVMGILGVIDNDSLTNDIIQKTNIINKMEAENYEIIRKLKNDNMVLNLYVRGEKYKGVNENDLIKNYSPAIDDNGNVLTYSDLKSTKDSLQSLNNRLQTLYSNRDFEIEVLKFKLNLIEKNYDISINEKYELSALKVDSALRIYPFYKHQLLYDKEKNKWFIRK